MEGLFSGYATIVEIEVGNLAYTGACREVEALGTQEPEFANKT